MRLDGTEIRTGEGVGLHAGQNGQEFIAAGNPD